MIQRFACAVVLAAVLLPASVRGYSSSKAEVGAVPVLLPENVAPESVMCEAPVESAAGDVPPASGTIKFAFITDDHYSEGSRSISDLRACIRDINQQDSIAFVVFGGDITDFGTGEQFRSFKSMADSLDVKYWVIAGNHDANWSESGCNDFLTTFGYEQFEFEYGGWRFLGTNCGPDMRMSPALVPRESILWMRSLKPKKSIFFNHYPLDSCMLNYFDVLKAVKKADVRYVIGGHMHANRKYDYSGLPGSLCRSSLAGKNAPGYTIVRIKGDDITLSERRVWSSSAIEFPAWNKVAMKHVADTVTYDSHGLPGDYPWMRYDVNDSYPQVREVWRINEKANVVAGFAHNGKLAFYPTSNGEMVARSLKDGRQKWRKSLSGKIFSTPAISGKYVVTGCSDGYIYALNAGNGKLLWKHKCNKAVVASPVIMNGKVYCAASDGCFRCLNLKDGSSFWTFTEVRGHASSTPYIDEDQVVFGTWGNTLYSLDPATGRLQWKWEVGKRSKMYSPANCVPVKSKGRIFVAVPDRHVYAIDAKTGKQLFSIPMGRDAICLSEDGSTVFAKTLFSSTYAFSADMVKGEPLKWDVNNHTRYELSPSPLCERDGVVLHPTDKGNIIALDASDGHFLWAHKISIGLVNPLDVVSSGKGLFFLASTMDGAVTLISAE